MANILIFGDSLVQGFYDTEGGWVDRLKRHFQQIEPPEKEIHTRVYNLGIAGATSKDIIKRFECETKQRSWDGDKTVVIFACGVNDSTVRNDNNIVTPKEFKRNCNKLISMARKFTSTIAFVEQTPVNESFVTPMPWAITDYYYNKSIDKYNDLIKDVCRAEGVHFIDLFHKLTRSDYTKMLSDGAHPNSKGHDHIYKTVKAYLETSDFLK